MCFINPKGNPIPNKQSFSVLPSPNPLATTNLLPVFMDLPILDISYQWKHTICDLLCLASFF